MARARILIVDDEPEVLQAIRRLFWEDDYEVLPATSGPEGLRILEQEEPVQVVISDYRMPGMDGISFLREVWTRWPRTVRFVLSGIPDAAAAVEAINEGQIFKFVAKPWDDEELRGDVAVALQVYEQRERNDRLVEDLLGASLADDAGEVGPEAVPEATAGKILAALPMAVLCLNDTFRIVQSNGRADSLFGNGKTLVGQTAAALPAAVNAFLSEFGSEERRMAFDQDGSSYLVTARELHLDDGGKGTVLVFLPSSRLCRQGDGKGLETKCQDDGVSYG